MQANQSLCVCYFEVLGAVSRRKCPQPQPPVRFLRLSIINCFSDTRSRVFLEGQGRLTALSLSQTPQRDGAALSLSSCFPFPKPHRLYGSFGARTEEWQLPHPAGVPVCLSRQAVLFWGWLWGSAAARTRARTPLHRAASPSRAPRSRFGGGFAGDVAAVSSWGERSPPGSLPRSAVCSLLTFISWGASYSPNI